MARTDRLLRLLQAMRVLPAIAPPHRLAPPTAVNHGQNRRHSDFFNSLDRIPDIAEERRTP
jgi:hypothetical protein